MKDSTLSVYATADWGAKLIGAALVHKDAQGTLVIDGVPVETVQVIGQFSVLNCVDGRSRVVLTSFLRMVSAPSPRAVGR
ncbi:MAG: hypothetical protein HGA19_07285 [Oscillochloris sp.]|nr:hypothetical protein [Oscillochloris sp.]